jgi:tRNA nucleotidyltransferase (CCA-adding enzyme)
MKSPEFTDLLSNELLGTARDAARDRECHLVGGALRDCFLGLGSPDLDLVVAGRGLDFSKDLALRLGARLVRLGGARFSAFRLVGTRFVLDVWDRADTSLESDLERRDLTINAIALDLFSGAVIDPFEGLADLERRCLRAVTSGALDEDPLRVLRLVRFATYLPFFEVESSTFELARTASPKLAGTAVERRREELTRIFASGSPYDSIRLLLQLGALQILLDLDAEFEAFDARLERTLHAFETFEHYSTAIFELTPNRIVCLHALIAETFSGRRPAGSEEIPARQGLVTRRQARAISRLTATEPPALENPRTFLPSWGELWLEAAAIAFCLAPEHDEEVLIDWLRLAGNLLEAEGSEALDPAPLLDGHDLAEILEIGEGPLVGRLLGLLRDAQVRGELKTRDQAIAALPELLAAENRRTPR